MAVGSGKAAINASLLALLEPGDHLLVVDTAYGPTRRFCDVTLARLGIETTYLRPADRRRHRELMRPETRLVFTESPGSLTFEIQDVPAIVEAAHARDVLVMLDNTWASPLYFKPFAHGVDISVQAATKYIGGHSDLMMGMSPRPRPVYPSAAARVLTRWRPPPPPTTATWPCAACARWRHGWTGTRRAALSWRTGCRPGPRSSACCARPCPAIPATPCGGATSSALPACSASCCSRAARRSSQRMLDGLELFGMGYSWGGYESLLIPTQPASLPHRDAAGSRRARPCASMSGSRIRAI